MALTAWLIGRREDSAAIPLQSATAGEAIVKGTPLVFSSGKLVKVTGGGAASQFIVGVAAGAAAADGSECLYVPASPDQEFLAKDDGGTAPTVGVRYGLKATDLTVDSDITTAASCLVTVIGSETVGSATYWRVRVLGFAGPVS